MGQGPQELNQIPAVAAEVDVLRARAQALAEELERRLRARMSRAQRLVARGRDVLARGRRLLVRARDAVDVKAQLRRHPRLVIAIGAAATLAIGAAAYAASAHRRRPRRTLDRLHARLTAARASRPSLRALLSSPRAWISPPHARLSSPRAWLSSRLAPPREPLGRRLLTAMLFAAATAIARGLASLPFRREAPRRLPPHLPDPS